jgi:hypothetical protein
MTRGPPAPRRTARPAPRSTPRPGQLLIVSSVLDLAGDEDWLHYSCRRELRCDGILIRERG